MFTLTSLAARVAFLTIVWIVSAPSGNAQTVYRVDAYPVSTRTLTLTQFLKGEKNGQPATVAGILRVPGPLTVIEKKPLVILLSGLGGANSAHDNWAQELLDTGTAVFTLDSRAGPGNLHRTISGVSA